MCMNDLEPVGTWLSGDLRGGKSLLWQVHFGVDVPPNNF